MFTMNSFDNWVREISSYTVVGGLVGLPLAMFAFPWIYLAMLPPVLLAFMQIWRLKKSGNGFFKTWFYSPGVFIGTASIFHLYHGIWDYQGVLLGTLGWIGLAPILYLFARTK